VKSPLSALNAVIAISAGIIVLLGYFIPGLEFLRLTILAWASIAAGFALLVGVINLLSVHWNKFTSGQPGRVYSLIVVVSFLAAAIITGLSGPTGKWSLWILNNIQIPIEASLLALLVVTLTITAIRMVRRRFDVFTALFLGAALVALAGAAPLYWIGEVRWLSSLREWLSQVPATAGVRGILIGVGLGAIATGLRVLMGADRPYGG
jgi:hypothetical protein